ncbi:MAG: cold shock domain-containing protein [Anaerolineae bacterium]|nr:cold shock domain-containing protein [Anaerolineae bacterium]
MLDSEPRRGRRRRSRRSSPRQAPAQVADSSDVRRGVVKWFNRSRSYGFIQCDDGTEVFVHESAVVLGSSDLPLAKGRVVEFEVRDTPKGHQAVNVVVVTERAPAPDEERQPEAPAAVQDPPTPFDLTKRLPNSWKRRPITFVYTYTIYNRRSD